MVAQKKTKASKFLTVPTRPVPIDRDRSIAGLLEKMEGAGFGARQLAEAHRIWLDMLDDNSTIYLCGSGNLIPSGMRRLISGADRSPGVRPSSAAEAPTSRPVGPKT